MLEETTEEFHQSVCETFNTSVKQVRQDVKVLRQWLDSQPHLPLCASDTMLTCYLIACKNRMERAKEKIENYYTARLEIPEIFADRDPLNTRVQECAQEIRMFTLPKLTPDGCRVCISSFVTGDPDKFDVWSFAKRAVAAEDLKLEREAFTRGCYFVLDGAGSSFGLVFKLTPHLARSLIHCAQDVLPIIIKGIIFINSPLFVAAILSIIKPLMKNKLFQKIHIHSEGPEVLEQYFPISILPKEYGGDEESADTLNEAWMKRMEEQREWFLKEGSLTVDKSKKMRKKPSVTREDDFPSMQGSFKALCID